jgi:hypothetical protein
MSKSPRQQLGEKVGEFYDLVVKYRKEITAEEFQEATAPKDGEALYKPGNIALAQLIWDKIPKEDRKSASLVRGSFWGTRHMWYVLGSMEKEPENIEHYCADYWYYVIDPASPGIYPPLLLIEPYSTWWRAYDAGRQSYGFEIVEASEE